jgi:predicted glycogen debranching enzyme
LHIIHSFNGKRIDEHTSSDAAFLITNKKGNYLSLGKKNFSHTQGLLFFEHERWELYKTIEDIKLDKEMTSIKNGLSSVERLYKDDTVESFNLFNNSLVYSVHNYTGELVLELDFREIFNYDDKGRIYSITKEDDIIIIRYDKFTDHSLSVIDKTRFLAIKGAREFKQIGEWLKKDYSYDTRRGSKSEFFIYKALSIPVNGHAELVFSFSDDKEKAKEHVEQIYENVHYLMHSIEKYMVHTFKSHDLALDIAMKALDDLVISTESKERSVGVLAGLPWFYQFWARDELISLKALMLQDKHNLVKSILFKYLAKISDDGLIQSRFPGTNADVKSIDSVGWLFLRLREYIETLVSKKILNSYLSLSELIAIKRALEKAIHGLVHNHTIGGLVINNSQESWMDTKPANRRGACIEIQALFLSMINLHNYIASLTKSKQLFKGIEKEYKEKVREAFFDGETLYDSLTEEAASDAIRPNVFLAYYIYPDLLTKKEWKTVFDDTLKALWLDWGGLSTINHTNSLFRAEYTGVDDASYHNGDSWYYINNYAALAMHRLDKEHYAKQISRIVQASKEEMLFSGFIGCCAEVSSAKQMKSEGCLSQAWSMASFIELLHEMHRQ